MPNSKDNTQTTPFAQRDHYFSINGTTSFKIIVDPTLTPDGNVIVYAALSGGTGGIWRSLDSGIHCTASVFFTISAGVPGWRV